MHQLIISKMGLNIPAAEFQMYIYTLWSQPEASIEHISVYLVRKNPNTWNITWTETVTSALVDNFEGT